MARWTEPLDAAFRRPPNLVSTRAANAPPVLPFDEALDRLRTQALTDWAVRRDADGRVPGSTHEEPMTWDDAEQSLLAQLDSYRQAPRALVLQLGVEVQKLTPWWRHTGLGLDQYLDPTPGRSPVGKVVWSPAPETVDDLVFGDLYLLPGQYPKWVSESVKNVRREYGITQAFSLAPTCRCDGWAGSASCRSPPLSNSNAAPTSPLCSGKQKPKERPATAYDMWHNRHAETVFMTPALGRRVLRAGSIAEFADELVNSIQWLTDRDVTEQRLRDTLATDVAKPAVRR